MVVALGPGKFYGSSLPRPRIYTDVKFNDERVDPPVSVTDPIISWAQEAHWSMGGLSFQRHRLQGRIEGNIQKLRAEREKTCKKKAKAQQFQEEVSTPSPPAAPVAVKRRRRRVLEDEEEEDEVDVQEVEYKRRTVRKLKDEFDEVATRRSPLKSVDGGGFEVERAGVARTRSRSVRAEVENNVSRNVNKEKVRSRKLVKGMKGGAAEMEVAANGTRTSPRLAKSRLS